MKRLLVSERNTSVSTSSCDGSVSDRDEHGEEQRDHHRDRRERDERTRGAQLDQLGLQQGAHSSPPVMSKNASSSERETATSSVSAILCSFATSPTTSGDDPRTISVFGAVRLGGEALCPQRIAGSWSPRGGAHPRDRAVGRTQHALERPARTHHPVGDDDHVVDALRDLGQQVAGHEHGTPARRLGAQHVADPADAGRIETVHRLVQDQHVGVSQQRRGDRQALAHAHRVTLHAPAGGVRQAHDLQHLVDPARIMPARGGEHAQVVAPVAPGMEARILEHGAHMRARVGKLSVAAAVERGHAGVGMDQPQQHAQRGALAGAVGPEKAGHAAGLHGERQVGDGPDLAEALAYALDLDCCHRCRR